VATVFNTERPYSPIRIVAGKGQVMTALGGGVSDSDYTQSSTRIVTKTGPGGAKGLRLAYGNFYRSSGDHDGANDIRVKAAIEIRDSSNVGHTYPLTFDGKQEVTISATSGLVLTDPIGVVIRPNTMFVVRSEVVVDSGGQFPTQVLVHSCPDYTGSSKTLGGENSIKSTGPSLVYDTGFFAGTAVRGYGPYAILGEQIAPTPSVVIIGDSIADGSGDATNDSIIAGGLVGFSRGMMLSQASPGIVLPYVKITKTGDSLNFDSTMEGFDNMRSWSALQWATHAIVGLGNNDISGTSLSTIQTKMIYLWRQIQNMGCKVYQVTMFPRTTGSWDSAAGQTISSNYGTRRDQLNDWLRNIAVQQGYVDGIIDPQYLVEDQGNPGKWASDSGALTADGTHPNATAHKLIGEEIRQAAITFTV
jgi:lysophospholipase L1-like esterase